METTASSFQRLRASGLLAYALVAMIMVSIVSILCDCPLRLGPIVDGAVVVGDPDHVLEPWRIAGSLHASELESVKVRSDDRTVDLTFGGGSQSCWLVGIVSVVPSSKQIAIGIYGGYLRLPPGTVCTAEEVVFGFSLRFDEPVAGRPIESVERLSAPY